MTELRRLWDYDEEVVSLLEKRAADFTPSTLARVFGSLRSPLVEGDLEDRDRWRILKRIVGLERAGVALPPDLQSMSATLKLALPHWDRWYAHRLDRHERVRTGGRPAPSDKYLHELGTLSVADLAQRMLARPGYHTDEGEAYDKHFSELMASRPEQVLEVILHAARAFSPPTREDDELPVVESFPMEAATLLTKLPRTADLKVLFLQTWDALCPHCIRQEIGNRLPGDDAVGVAINHPGGRIVEAILGFFLPEPIPWDSGIDIELSRRLELLLTSRDAASAHSCVVIASRAFALRVADVKWTVDTVVPTLDWGNPRALACWQGFLWNGRVDEALFLSLRTLFLSAFDHYEELGSFAESLSSILVSVALEGPELLPAVDCKLALTRMPAAGRKKVAWILARRLADAEDAAASLWRERIGPWVMRCWPDTQGARDGDVSDFFIWAAIEARDAFADAIDTLLQKYVLGPVRPHSLTFHRLSRSLDLVRAHRKAALLLLDRLSVTSDVGGDWRSLRPVLNVIAEESELTALPEYRAVANYVHT